MNTDTTTNETNTKTVTMALGADQTSFKVRIEADGSGNIEIRDGDDDNYSSCQIPFSNAAELGFFADLLARARDISAASVVRAERVLNRSDS